MLRSFYGPFVFLSLFVLSLGSGSLNFLLLNVAPCLGEAAAIFGWIMPIVIASAFVCSATSFDFSYYVQRHTSVAYHVFGNNALDLPIAQCHYPLSFACFAYGAFRLWLAVRQADDSRPQVPPSRPPHPRKVFGRRRQAGPNLESRADDPQSCKVPTEPSMTYQSDGITPWRGGPFLCT